MKGWLCSCGEQILSQLLLKLLSHLCYSAQSLFHNCTLMHVYVCKGGQESSTADVRYSAQVMAHKLAMVKLPLTQHCQC